jgi:hypothetical protein
MDRKVISITSIVISLLLGFFMIQQQHGLDTLETNQLAIQELLKEKEMWARNTYCDRLKLDNMHYEYDTGYKQFVINRWYIDYELFEVEIARCKEEWQETTLSKIYN